MQITSPRPSPRRPRAVPRDVLPVDASTLSTGVTLQTRLDQALGTGRSRVDDAFTAAVAEAVTTRAVARR